MWPSRNGVSGVLGHPGALAPGTGCPPAALLQQVQSDMRLVSSRRKPPTGKAGLQQSVGIKNRKETGAAKPSPPGAGNEVLERVEASSPSQFSPLQRGLSLLSFHYLSITSAVLAHVLRRGLVISRCHGVHFGQKQDFLTPEAGLWEGPPQGSGVEVPC